MTGMSGVQSDIKPIPYLSLNGTKKKDGKEELVEIIARNEVSSKLQAVLLHSLISTYPSITIYIFIPFLYLMITMLYLNEN